ncbi:MAG: Spy/CpxP family protein refolding chaperone [bacterium]|nr:Spy/CpxP family protein refolding chaperone [bacterium]
MKKILGLILSVIISISILGISYAQTSKPLIRVNVKLIVTDPLKYDLGKTIPEVDVDKLNLTPEQKDKLTKLREKLQENEIKYQRQFANTWNKTLKPAVQKSDQNTIKKAKEELLNTLKELQKARINYYFEMQKILTQEQLKHFPILFTKEQVDRFEQIREDYDRERLNLDIARMIEAYKVQELRKGNASTKEINTRIALIVAIDNKKKDDLINYRVALREVLTKEQREFLFAEKK